MVAVGQITLLLRQVEGGREGALDQLMALVYAELERMAGSYLRKHFGNRAEAITLEPAASAAPLQSRSSSSPTRWRSSKP